MDGTAIAQPRRASRRRSGPPVSPSDFGIGRLFHRIRDAVVVAEATTGRIVLWNPAAETLFGYSTEEALGLSVEMIVPRRLRARHRAGIARYAATGYGALIDSVHALELPALRKDGAEITVELSLSPIEDVLVEGRFVLAIIRNVIERKRVEDARIELIRAQAARAQAEAAVRTRDEFLAAVSHDLKSPLTSIKGNAQLLRRQVEDGAEIDRATLAAGLARVEGTVARMTAMINELMDVARLQVGQPLELNRRSTDLVALAHQVAAEQQAATSHHQIVVDAKAPRLVGSWDRLRLERVLDNLISNAIKYSPDGGRIRIALQREAGTAGDWAIVQVQDPGMGIPAADLPHVFERFYRGGNVIGRARGMGIGLAGACDIVRQHGGRIDVQSKEGAGTNFTMRLPLNDRDQR
jgi:PAS domain S-box-containing protein